MLYFNLSYFFKKLYTKNIKVFNVLLNIFYIII
jgi:hypothetical protein